MRSCLKVLKRGFGGGGEGKGKGVVLLTSCDAIMLVYRIPNLVDFYQYDQSSILNLYISNSK